MRGRASIRTRFYQKNKSGTALNADFLDSSYKIPGGGWLSSADDLAPCEVALLGHRRLKKPTRDMMWTSQKTSDGKSSGYGSAVSTGTVAGVAEVSPGGSQQGTSTYHHRPGAASAVVLINMENADTGALATPLQNIALGAPCGQSGKIAPLDS